jgi:hypothetical protein
MLRRSGLHHQLEDNLSSCVTKKKQNNTHRDSLDRCVHKRNEPKDDHGDVFKSIFLRPRACFVVQHGRINITQRYTAWFRSLGDHGNNME